jgi:DNA modification methylase
MAILSEKLRYWWMLVALHEHGVQRFPGKFVMVHFKPVLWFVKDHRRGRTLMPDLLKGSKPDKEAHDWAQGREEIAPLVENLSEPGELILDPFAGTAGWGRVAASMGRRWLGADIQEGLAG